MMEYIKIITEIEKKFKGIQKPEITKRIARAFDDEWIVDDERKLQLHSMDKEQNWYDIPDSEIEEYADVLVWLDSAGFYFYYPAFLRYVLRNPIPDERVHLEVLEVKNPKEQFKEFPNDKLVFIISVLREISKDKPFCYYDITSLCSDLSQLIEEKKLKEQK